MIVSLVFVRYMFRSEGFVGDGVLTSIVLRVMSPARFRCANQLVHLNPVVIRI
jgi:hypothetical protein